MALFLSISFSVEAQQLSEEARLPDDAVQPQPRGVVEAVHSIALAPVREVVIPTGASQTMEDFLVCRAGLLNDLTKIINRVRSLPPLEQQRSLEQWRQGTAAPSELQARRAQQLSQEASSQVKPTKARKAVHSIALAPVREVVIPTGASQTMEDFLVCRAGLLNDLTKIINRVRSLPPLEQQRSLEQWRQDTAAASELQARRAQQLSQEASSQVKPTEVREAGFEKQTMPKRQ